MRRPRIPRERERERDAITMIVLAKESNVHMDLLLRKITTTNVSSVAPSRKFKTDAVQSECDVFKCTRSHTHTHTNKGPWMQTDEMKNTMRIYIQKLITK